MAEKIKYRSLPGLYPEYKDNFYKYKTNGAFIINDDKTKMFVPYQEKVIVYSIPDMTIEKEIKTPFGFQFESSYYYNYQKVNVGKLIDNRYLIYLSYIKSNYYLHLIAIDTEVGSVNYINTDLYYISSSGFYYFNAFSLDLLKNNNVLVSAKYYDTSGTNGFFKYKFDKQSLSFKKIGEVYYKYQNTGNGLLYCMYLRNKCISDDKTKMFFNVYKNDNSGDIKSGKYNVYYILNIDTMELSGANMNENVGRYCDGSLIYGEDYNTVSSHAEFIDENKILLQTYDNRDIKGTGKNNSITIMDIANKKNETKFREFKIDGYFPVCLSKLKEDLYFAAFCNTESVNTSNTNSTCKFVLLNKNLEKIQDIIIPEGIYLVLSGISLESTYRTPYTKSYYYMDKYIIYFTLFGFIVFEKNDDGVFEFKSYVNASIDCNMNKKLSSSSSTYSYMLFYPEYTAFDGNGNMYSFIYQSIDYSGSNKIRSYNSSNSCIFKCNINEHRDILHTIIPNSNSPKNSEFEIVHGSTKYRTTEKKIKIPIDFTENGQLYITQYSDGYEPKTKNIPVSFKNYYNYYEYSNPTTIEQINRQSPTIGYNKDTKKNSILFTLGEKTNSQIQYRINPNSKGWSSWSPFFISPYKMEYRLQEPNCYMTPDGQNNSIQIEVRDIYSQRGISGGTSSSNIQEVKGYKQSIVLRDKYFNYYGNKISDQTKINFSLITIGRTTEIKELIVDNRMEIPAGVKVIPVHGNIDDKAKSQDNIFAKSMGLKPGDSSVKLLPRDARIELSKTESPFVAEDNFTLDTMQPGEFKKMYCRVKIGGTVQSDDDIKDRVFGFIIQTVTE